MIALAIYVGSVMLVSLSAWRGQKNTGGTLGLPEIVVLAAQDPFVHLQQQGLDTVDGLILATKVDRKLTGAKATDPLKTVTGSSPTRSGPPSRPGCLPRLRSCTPTSARAGGSSYRDPDTF